MALSRFYLHLMKLLSRREAVSRAIARACSPALTPTLTVTLNRQRVLRVRAGVTVGERDTPSKVRANFVLGSERDLSSNCLLIRRMKPTIEVRGYKL